MRTAITLAKSHDGKWQLLATPNDSLIEQKRSFRALRSDKAHADFSTVIYQESDGQAEIIRLLTPEAKQKQEEAARADLEASKTFDEQQIEKAAVKTGKKKSK